MEKTKWSLDSKKVTTASKEIAGTAANKVPPCISRTSFCCNRRFSFCCNRRAALPQFVVKQVKIFRSQANDVVITGA